MQLIRTSLKFCVIGLISGPMIGCETKSGSGALIGAGAGAVVGGLIGSNSHGRAGEGAAIGAAAGAIGGGLIGHGMDENDKKQSQANEYDRRNGNSQQWKTSSTAVTQSQVIDWTDQGVRDDIIIDRIDRSGTVFRLSAADQNDLRDHGVSESVIRAMKDTARR